jgi:hypothetical protein
LGVGLTILPCKKIVEKPPRNSAGLCGGGQGISWAVEPRKEGERNTDLYGRHDQKVATYITSWYNINRNLKLDTLLSAHDEVILENSEDTELFFRH